MRFDLTNDSTVHRDKVLHFIFSRFHLHWLLCIVAFVFRTVVVNLISSTKEIFAFANFILRAINQEHLLGGACKPLNCCPSFRDLH